MSTSSPPSGTTWAPDSSATIRTAGNGSVSTRSPHARKVPSGRAVTADFRCRTLRSGTATTRRPRRDKTCPSWRMPSAVVRPPCPTYTVHPTWSTSPPSSVPGASMRPDVSYRRLNGTDLPPPLHRCEVGRVLASAEVDIHRRALDVRNHALGQTRAHRPYQGHTAGVGGLVSQGWGPTGT